MMKITAAPSQTVDMNRNITDITRTMRALTFILFAMAIHSGHGVETEKIKLVEVTAIILSQPKDFVFPGCRCEQHTIEPVKAHSSELKIIRPVELKGEKLSIYHLPPLPKYSVWFSKGSTVAFSIDQDSLGSLYDKNDRRHTNKIPYSNNIHGELRIITEQ